MLEEAAKENTLGACVLGLFLQLLMVGVEAPGLDWPGACLQGSFFGRTSESGSELALWRDDSSILDIPHRFVVATGSDVG